MGGDAAVRRSYTTEVEAAEGRITEIIQRSNRAQKGCGEYAT